jgi:hypothetical protein
MGFHHNGNGSSGKARPALLPDVLAAIRERVAVLTDAGAGATACHGWRGSLHPNGCGWPRLRFGGRSWSVRQLAWLLLHGELPRRVWRTCTQPWCVNALHLSLVNPRRHHRHADAGKLVSRPSTAPEQPR